METKVTIKHYDIEASVTLSVDADLNDLLTAVNGMVISCGWNNKSWKYSIISLAEHYKIMNNENNK